MDKIKYFCSKDCPDACEFYIEIKNSKVIFTPIKDKFLNKGFVCKKLKGFYKREIEENSFYKNDNIIENLAQFLSKNRNKKILFYRGSGSLGYYMGFWDKLFSHFENCYFINGSPCDETGIIAHTEDFGVCINPDIENLERTDSIILFGKNAYITSPHLFLYLNKLKKTGKNIIYIDPIKSKTAQIANNYIQINPATDGILAYLILAKLGYEKYDKNLLNIVGISENELETVVNNTYNNKTGIIVGMGLQRYSNGKNAIQWINRLAYHTNNINNLYYSRSSKEGIKKIDINKKNTINIVDIPKFLRKNFFDIIVVVAANPVVTMPENSIWIDALNKAKTVVIDTNQTETTKYADYFIKVGGMFSQDEIQGSYFFNKTLKRKAFLNDTPSDIDIIKQLPNLLNIDIDMPDIENIKTTSQTKKRLFNNKTIDLKLPYNEQNKIRLITLSHEDYLNSQTEIIEKDTIFISKKIAKKLSIKDRDIVTIKNKQGQCKVMCQISDKIKGYNAFAYKNRSLCFNSLTKSTKTDANLAISYYDLFVSIE